MAACFDPRLHQRYETKTALNGMDMKKTVLCSLLLSAACLCIGWADSWDELKAAAASVHSIQADFVQEKHLPILAQPLVSQGRFYFREPRSLRWEYSEPIRSILIMHAGRVRRYVADGSQWVSESGPGMEAMQMVLQEIAHWMAGRFDQNPSFEARLEPGRRIVLTPRTASLGEVIQHIVLNLGPEPGIMAGVVIQEHPDAFTRLTFTRTRLNPPLDDALFRKVP